MHEHIPKVFYTKVDRAARDIAGKWPQTTWEDLRQDMWVHLLERPNQLEQLVAAENPRDQLKKVAQQSANRVHSAYELFSGQYQYGADEVKELLEMGVITNPEETTLVESTDLATAMLMLKESNRNYFDAIVDKYVHNKPVLDRNLVSRGVIKTSEFMNRVNKSNRYVDHQGPGARQAISSAAGQAQRGTQWQTP